MKKEIKVGDFLGRSNFPYEIGEVINIQGDIFLVKMLARQANNKQDIIRPITKKQIEKGFFEKMNIVDAEVIS